MKVCIQAGHKGRTSGSTGAPGEQKWTSEIVPKISQKLREKGVDVKEVGADPSNSEISGDWDLFLSVHYDADVYNDRGGFVDYPEPSTDFATDESQRIAQVLSSIYFSETGIPNHPERSNANTRYYYMWSKLSKATPCVLIEAGVGWRTPEDHKTLWFEQEKVSGAIAKGILIALGVEEEKPEPPQEDCEEKVREAVKKATQEVTAEYEGKIRELKEKHQQELNEDENKKKEELENLRKKKDQEIEEIGQQLAFCRKEKGSWTVYDILVAIWRDISKGLKKWTIEK